MNRAAVKALVASVTFLAVGSAPAQPSPKPDVRILSVECAEGLAVRVHVVVDSPGGIASFEVWSTWMGGPPFEKTFPAPYPTHVDQVVTVAHAAPDAVDRDHQWGLKVTVPGLAAPVLTYAMEPKGADGRQRCPGHYRAPAPPQAKITSVECGEGLAVSVHVLIDNPAGIASFRVWSTWGGGSPFDRTFSAPFPTHVDQVVPIAHSAPDTVDRDHQWGLKVSIGGAASPILTYATEPKGPGGRMRCHGHYVKERTYAPREKY